jgi:CHASE3 domain sensor protein
VDLNTTLCVIVGLIALVVAAQVWSVQKAERKIGTAIHHMTEWMSSQEQINTTLAASNLKFDKFLLSKGLTSESLVAGMIAEIKDESK